MNLPTVPARLGWPQALPMEVALNIYPLEEVLDRCGMSAEDYLQICESEAYQVALAEAREAVLSVDRRFQAKAAAIAEEGLTELYTALKSEDTPSAGKLAIMKELVSWAGTAAARKEDSKQAGPGAGGVVINIKFPDGTNAATAQALGGNTYDAETD